MRGLFLGAAAAVAAMATLDHGPALGPPVVPAPEPWPPQRFRASKSGKSKNNRAAGWGKHKGSKRAKKAARKGGNPAKA